MQFQVPQFIEVEDKIFGPLTFRQFIYCGGGLGGAYVLYRILPLYVAAPIMAAVVGLAVSLAFLKFNGRPFITALESGFFFLIHSKLYLWNNARKTKYNVPVIGKLEKSDTQTYVPKLSDSRLHELAWSLDIKERVASGLATNPGSHVFSTGAEPDLVAAVRTAHEALPGRSGSAGAARARALD